MTKTTITEALAELKTLGKRIEKKREYVGMFLTRQEGLKDPLTKDGGSVAVIERERQAIRDLEQRHVDIRLAVQRANHAVNITIGDTTKTIAEWLTWRKEIAPGAQTSVNKLRMAVQQARHQAQTKGLAVVAATVNQTAERPTDLLVNVDEAALAREAEDLEMILGALDGQLSLKNATVTVEY